jgi:tight adherence protein C
MLVVVTLLVAAGLSLAVVLALLPPSHPTGVARSLDLIRELAGGGAVGASAVSLRAPGPSSPGTSSLPVSSALSAASPGAPGSSSPGLSFATSSTDRSGQRRLQPLLTVLGRLGERITPSDVGQRLRRRMDLAGNNPPWDLPTLLVLKASGTLALGGIGLLVFMVSASGAGLLLCAILTCLGYWMADLLLYNVGAKRQEAMRRAAPDALDMLTVCVEAGLGFDAALAKVAANSSGPLAEEFARVIKEVQLGRARREAFADLADRTDIGEIRTFVGALVQADRLGVPIAGVLRQQSGELRLRRRQRAEEAAQKVPVKIIFPVMVCIFPAFFVIVIGPGAIRIAEVFSHG